MGKAKCVLGQNELWRLVDLLETLFELFPEQLGEDQMRTFLETKKQIHILLSDGISGPGREG